MWQTLMGMTSQREILAHVCFLDPLYPEDRHRRDLARESREAILLTLFPAAQHSTFQIDPVESKAETTQWQQ